MPDLIIPPLLSPIPSPVWLRYFSINQSNINSRTAEEMPRHTRGPAAGVLRGIPINDWSEGHFEWHREGCDCVVKLCPQHCRELVGSNDHDEGPEVSGRNDVDDNYDGEDDNDGTRHSDEDHDGRNSIPSTSDDDPKDSIPSVLPSIERGNQSGSGPPSLSASPEEIAQDDPEATISPENRDEMESPVQRPEQQPPPAALTINADYLEALSPGFRARLVTYVEAISEELRAYILPQAPASTASANPPTRLLAVYQPSRHLAREIRHLIREAQALYPLSDSVTPDPRPGPGGHLQRSPSDILAHVLNTSPSPRVKVGPSGSGSASQAVRGGGGEGSVGSSATSRTPAQPQPGPSQPMPQPSMGVFFTSAPKAVARRLFSRSDPSQRPSQRQQPPQLEPRPTSSTPANTTTTTRRRAPDPQPPNVRQPLSEPAPAPAPAPHPARPPPNMSSPPQQQQQQQQQPPRSSTSAHKKTLPASRASSRPINEQDEQEEQDIQGEPSGSNVDSRQLEEESSNLSELEEESAEQDELAPTRPKRGRPKKSGSTVTYGKRGNKRRRV